MPMMQIIEDIIINNNKNIIMLHVKWCLELYFNNIHYSLRKCRNAKVSIDILL